MTMSVPDTSALLHKNIREMLSPDWLLLRIDGSPNERRTTWCALHSNMRTRVEYTARIGTFPTTLLALVEDAERRLARRATWSRRFDIAIVVGVSAIGIATIVAQWAG